MASPIYRCILELNFLLLLRRKKLEIFTTATGEKLRGRRLRLSIKGLYHSLTKNLGYMTLYAVPCEFSFLSNSGHANSADPCF
jgi:hypothetical protein